MQSDTLFVSPSCVYNTKPHITKISHGYALLLLKGHLVTYCMCPPLHSLMCKHAMLPTFVFFQVSVRV